MSILKNAFNQDRIAHQNVDSIAILRMLDIDKDGGKMA
jgi:hypothetical protein